MDSLCQVWLKLAHWRKRFINFIYVLLLLCYYLPLEKGVALHLNELESLYPLLWAKFGWNWPQGSGEEDKKCEKFTTTERTNCNQQVAHGSHCPPEKSSNQLTHVDIS